MQQKQKQTRFNNEKSRMSPNVKATQRRQQSSASKAHSRQRCRQRDDDDRNTTSTTEDEHQCPSHRGSGLYARDGKPVATRRKTRNVGSYVGNVVCDCGGTPIACGDYVDYGPDSNRARWRLHGDHALTHGSSRPERSLNSRRLERLQPGNSALGMSTKKCNV